MRLSKNIGVGIRLILALGLATAALSGCGTGTEDDPTGRTWNLVELEGSALVDGTEINMTIEDGVASGSAGCNTYNGPATLTDDGGMTLGPNFAMTFMACADDINAQEQRYVEAMTRVTSYEMESEQLLLLDDDGITVLEYGG